MADMDDRREYDEPAVVPEMGETEQDFGFEESIIRCTDPRCETKPFMVRFFFRSGYIKLECPDCDVDITEQEPFLGHSR